MGIGNFPPGAADGQDICSSLPLMGIGNPVWYAADYDPETGAHYPSWGSETRPRPNDALLPSVDSLPLMGIGNMRSMSLYAVAATHYPSWGSETPPRTVRCRT